MANQCNHEHQCFECGKPFTCDAPECQTLTGRQRLCMRCSYLYGWAQRREGRSEVTVLE